MPDLRELIREILAEVLESLPELAAGSKRERVTLRGDDDLNAFAASLIERAKDRDFAEAVRDGRHVFAFDRPNQPVERQAEQRVQPSPIVSSKPAEVAALTKSLITERDLAQLGLLQGRLRIGSKSRLTPLAADELKRRGVKIERMQT
jgi:hypothetical protein